MKKNQNQNAIEPVEQQKNGKSQQQESNELIPVHKDDIYALFNSFSSEFPNGISEQQFLRRLEKMGIRTNDSRLKPVLMILENIPQDENGRKIIQYSDFDKIVNSAHIVRQALLGEVAIPEFEDFCKEIKALFEEVQNNRKGKAASYIPQLAEINPDYFAVSICTVDGQRFSLGDIGVDYTLQSTSKPLTYCMVLEELGEDIVHRHVDKEPSGLAFNELKLKPRRIEKDGHGGGNDPAAGPAAVPHNPLINAGAIMCCSLLQRNKTLDKRLEYVVNSWRALTQGVLKNQEDVSEVERDLGRKPRFNAEVFLGERRTADRNNALAYFMRENNAFMENDKVDIQENLDLYFQCCSIEINAEQMSIAASTLANAGVNPLTGRRIFQPQTVRNCLSVMYTCGMYDYSGEFAFRVGLPAKSGVSGALMVVVPNLFGLCIYSPRLDEYGNSCRGVEFCQKLVDKYKLHIYDGLVQNSDKKDPRNRNMQTLSSYMMELIFAAGYGDLDDIMKLNARGMDLSVADYDRRTALHLAASEGHLNVVQYLVNYYKKNNLSLSPTDRWGGTPLQDAVKNKHNAVVKLLESEGAV